MNRLSMGKCLSGVITFFAGAGALAVLFSAFTALAAEGDANAKTLAQLDEDWSKAAATRDADRVASFYAEDARVYPPHEPIAIGPPAAKKVWAAYFADPTFSISWKTVHAEVAKSGEFGYTAGTYEDSFQRPPGKVVSEKGKYVCIWKKQTDGTWKVVHDIWNTDAK